MDYVYLAGDLTRSYSRTKLDSFTRQIVYLRPDTFVILDRVISTNPSFVKTWQLQAVKPAERVGPFLKTTNDEGGRLFIQTLLPRDSKINLNSGEDLYSYGGESYKPEKIRGPAPECRISISPGSRTKQDWFLTVLTATDRSVDRPLPARCAETDEVIIVHIGEDWIEFRKEQSGGQIEVNGIERELTEQLP
jgi:heparin/heparan-sulfate lyase